LAGADFGRSGSIKAAEAMSENVPKRCFIVSGGQTEIEMLVLAGAFLAALPFLLMVNWTEPPFAAACTGVTPPEKVTDELTVAALEDRFSVRTGDTLMRAVPLVEAHGPAGDATEADTEIAVPGVRHEDRTTALGGRPEPEPIFRRLTPGDDDSRRSAPSLRRANRIG
jgi:hypothetical protein